MSKASVAHGSRRFGVGLLGILVIASTSLLLGYLGGARSDMSAKPDARSSGIRNIVPGAAEPREQVDLEAFVPRGVHQRELQRRANELKRARAEVSALASRNQQMKQRLASAVQERSRLAGKLGELRGVVDRMTGTLHSRMNKAIIRNAAGAGSGMIPIFGDAADAAATAVDVAEYCQISRDLEALNRRAGNMASSSQENMACAALQNRRWLRWPRFRWPWAR